MINIVSKPIEFEIELKKKIEFTCDFCNTKPKIINGNIRNIEHFNLSYIEHIELLLKELLSWHLIILKHSISVIYQTLLRLKI